MLSSLRRNPALWTGLTFAFGIALSFKFIAQINISVCAILLAVTIIFLIIFSKKSVSVFLILTLTLFFLLGLIYGYQHFAYFPQNHLLNFKHSKINGVRGWISETSWHKNGKHRYVLQCEQVFVDSQWQNAVGKILVFAQKGLPKLHYGQRLQIGGRLKLPALPSNPGQFNYRRYLNLKGIFHQIYLQRNSLQILPAIRGNPLQRSVLEPLRQHIRQAFDRYFAPSVSAILKALILGERQDLDRDLVGQFQKTGVVHVLAISGLHVGFVLLIFLIFFGFFPLSYKMRYLLTFFALGIFVALVNFKAPVVRASLMALFYFAIPLCQRKASPLNVLASAGFLILFFDPAQVLQSGFQFSFAAVGGIIYGYPHLKSMLPLHFAKNRFGQNFNRWVWQPALVSLSAVLATLPLTYYYYGAIQLGAVIINLFIIPLIGILVTGALLFVLFSFGAFPFLAGLAYLISWLVTGIIGLIHFFSGFDWVQLQVAHPSLWVVLFVSLFIIFLFRIYKERSLWYALICLAFTLLVLQSGRLQNLRVTFIDVGQGDACLIQLPDNRTNILIDAGNRTRWRDYGRLSVLPVLHYYGVRHLHYAIATHSHSDHYGGLLTVMESIKIDTLVVSPYPDSAKGYRYFLRKAAQHHIPIKKLQRGEQLNLGTNARLYALSPVSRFEKVRLHNGREINNSSLVLRLCYGQNSFLLTGDAQKEAEKIMDTYGSFLQSNVLKAGHHGSSTSSSADFLNFVQPAFAVISVGKKNKFHHPSRKTIAKLRALGVAILRTDQLGAFVFESNGQKLRPVNWRK